MAAQSLLTKAGRRIYKNAAGRFVSKAAFTEIIRKQSVTESFFRDQFGPPPSGQEWHSIAEKYPERFADYVDELNRIQSL